MIGAILCGGQSSRMGTDKGLLLSEKNTWARIAFDKLQALLSLTVVSVNEQQFLLYNNLFTENLLVPDDAAIHIGGPLCGILSIHKKYPGRDILVLACDMPLMHVDVLKELMHQYNRGIENKQAIVFINQNEAEPLCGIYKAAGLASIYTLYETNELGRHSMKHALELLLVKELVLPIEWQPFFKNFNARHELNNG